MRTHLLRHPLGPGCDAAALFSRLYGGRSDVFWLDGGATGASYLGTGRVVPLGDRVLDDVRAGLTGAELGLVGWFGYGLLTETVGLDPAVRSEHPDSAFLSVDRAIAVGPDGTGELLAIGDSWSGDLAAWRAEAVAAVGLAGAERDPVQASRPDIRRQDDDESYLAKIAECQDAIRDGDAYQICLTTELEVPGAFDPLAVFLALRESSPTHHAALVRIGAISLVSASPEQFLSITAEGRVKTRPIKGTRPRDPDPAADRALSVELLASEKERAENLMIVDLMRNDLSRVCELGSVEVTGLLEVESYAHVHQLVSTIEGDLMPGLDVIDVVRACFPAGSMTGAPKRRAIELLDRIEGRARGLYAGAFGYLAGDGRVDLAMTIRSIVIDDEGATIGTGGGITALSDPREELAEAELKAAALLDVLGVERG